ncbi:TetR/AcrR family transcriptional regulator [Sorangium sp. So ce204]|uniref:TetR/AcrR family transcriptional regulator n=1 Tax=Sorangium sp. So ce204 TaxID=3133288 RepID=UPI003F6243F0
MARTIPPDRFRQLVDVATDTFVARGYRMTQMADVASAIGVAKGTVYGYVESKEALFDLALRFADGPLAPDPAALPWRTPGQGATVAYIRERLVSESSELVLLQALGRPCPGDAAAEFADIARDLYRRLARNRRSLKLVDRCALDHPELAAAWFNEGRWAQHAALAHYLERRIAEGALRPVTNVSIAARFVLETIAFWAVHRHWDPSPQPLVEEEVEATINELVFHGLAKESS